MSSAFRKKRFREARKILNDLCLKIDGKEASTHKRPSNKPNPAGAQEAWWLEHGGTKPPFDSPRSKAYLRAYVEIAGPNFYGSGIPLESGLMHLDRGVMKAMLQNGCVTLGKSKRDLFELTPKGSDLISGMGVTTFAQLRPNRKRLVYDILKELKVEVSDWANYGKGKKKSPAANPKYCYDWAFEKPDQFIVLCLWYNELEEVNGSIIQFKNYRSRSINPHPVRVRRAEKADELLTKAYIHGLPIRVIINSSDEKKGGVKDRILDDAPWAVTSYDFDTGAHRLERGVPPEKNEGYEEVEYAAHEGEAWKRLALITQRKREWRLRAAKIEDALAKNNGRLICEVRGCGFNFLERYGEIGRNYTHVHHKEQLSKVPKSGKKVTLADLAIVCANCHAMVHVGGKCRELDTLILLAR